MDLIEKSGLHIRSSGARRLIAKTCDPGVEVLFARPIDIPEYVANGAADMGVTGRDMVYERGVDVEELLDLNFGQATLVLAVLEDSGIETPQQLEGAKIATEFPALASRYFTEKGVHVAIVPVGGACEATPHLGVADAIVDLTSSGTTLRMNQLKIIDEILRSSTVLIASHHAKREKAEKVEELRLAFESVIRAQGRCYLMMNVHRIHLDVVKEILPGLSGPTVMDVASSEGMVAVHAVVEEERIYQLITLLKRAGAKDILVMPIDRIIR
jgi:ATP phosphoribosyltransferase